jgi:hypothetical protein
LVVWIIFVGIMCAIESPPSSDEEWAFISAITAGIAIGSFALSYLGGHIIRGNKGAIRLGVLISVLWVVGSFVALEPYRSYWGGKSHSWTEFLEIGIISVISYWGILWVISGFLPSKKKMENS